VEPSSAEEVSFVLQTLIDTECHFAIKGGGHDRTPGSSNIDGGVTIDLVRLNHVKVSKDKKSVKIGAGLRWGDVYSALEKEGLMVVGGRLSEVGVGGLILGGKMVTLTDISSRCSNADVEPGGISFYSNRYGWACDNVLAYDIVVADGSIESASQFSNPDLYRSLRGAGGSNFGVVTSFTMETLVPANPAGMWGGNKVFSWDKVPELLRLNHIATTQSMEIDPDIAMWNTFGYVQAYDAWWGVEQFRHAVHSNLSTWPEAFQVYEKLEGIPNTTNISIKPLSNITSEISQSTPGGDRNLYGTFTYYPSIELEQRILDIYLEEVTPIKNITNFLPVAVMQPISRATIQKMKKHGGNALGIAESGEEGPLTIFSTSWTWRAVSDDERSYAAYYRIMEKAEMAAKEMGVWYPYKYINYAEATQDVWSGLGEENLRELRRVQRKVDPEGVFAKGGLGGGYFKLNDLSEGRGPKGKKKSRGEGKKIGSKSEL
jgi:FAD/FMN-containing dehydrogenase